MLGAAETRIGGSALTYESAKEFLVQQRQHNRAIVVRWLPKYFATLPPAALTKLASLRGEAPSQPQPQIQRTSGTTPQQNDSDSTRPWCPAAARGTLGRLVRAEELAVLFVDVQVERPGGEGRGVAGG